MKSLFPLVFEKGDIAYFCLWKGFKQALYRCSLFLQQQQQQQQQQQTEKYEIFSKKHYKRWKFSQILSFWSKVVNFNRTKQVKQKQFL